MGTNMDGSRQGEQWQVRRVGFFFHMRFWFVCLVVVQEGAGDTQNSVVAQSR